MPSLIEFLCIQGDFLFVQSGRVLSRHNLRDILEGRGDAGQEYDLDLLKQDKAHIRQLKISKNLAAICVHDGAVRFNLSVMNLESGELIKTVDEITSAIFCEAGRLIIATGNGHDENILVFDANSVEKLNTITLSFPGLHDDVQIDKYRLFTIERLQDGNFVAMGAYY